VAVAAAAAAATPSGQKAPENSVRTIAPPKDVKRGQIAAAGVHQAMRKPQHRENRVVTPRAIHVMEGGADLAAASAAIGPRGMRSRWTSWPTA
jgi:hypothetical protein